MGVWLFERYTKMNEMALFALVDAATRRFLNVTCVCRKRYKRTYNPTTSAPLLHYVSVPHARIGTSNQRVGASYRMHNVVGTNRAYPTVSAGSRA